MKKKKQLRIIEHQTVVMKMKMKINFLKNIKFQKSIIIYLEQKL